LSNRDNPVGRIGAAKGLPKFTSTRCSIGGDTGVPIASSSTRGAGEAIRGREATKKTTRQTEKKKTKKASINGKITYQQ